MPPGPSESACDFDGLATLACISHDPGAETILGAADTSVRATAIGYGLRN